MEIRNDRTLGGQFLTLLEHLLFLVLFWAVTAYGLHELDIFSGSVRLFLSILITLALGGWILWDYGVAKNVGKNGVDQKDRGSNDILPVYNVFSSQYKNGRQKFKLFPPGYSLKKLYEIALPTIDTEFREPIETGEFKIAGKDNVYLTGSVKFVLKPIQSHEGIRRMLDTGESEEKRVLLFPVFAQEAIKRMAERAKYEDGQSDVAASLEKIREYAEGWVNHMTRKKGYQVEAFTCTNFIPSQKAMDELDESLEADGYLRTIDKLQGDIDKDTGKREMSLEKASKMAAVLAGKPGQNFYDIDISADENAGDIARFLKDHPELAHKFVSGKKGGKK